MCFARLLTFVVLHLFGSLLLHVPLSSRCFIVCFDLSVTDIPFARFHDPGSCVFDVPSSKRFLRICDNVFRIEMQEHTMVDEATTMIMSGLIHWGALLREPYGVKETALSCDHGVDAHFYF